MPNEADASPIIWVAFSSDRHSPMEISDFANRIIKPRMQTLPGAADARLYGERRQAMRVWLDRDRLAAFGSAIGLAFQLADDLLDLTADAGTLGKATGKDAGAGKATLAGLHGAEWTRRQLNALVEEACGLLEPYGARASLLLDAARFVAIRDR